MVMTGSILVMAQNSASSPAESRATATSLQTPAHAQTFDDLYAQVLARMHSTAGLAPDVRRINIPLMFAAGCYTMRIYKVKRTEHLRDDDSGLRGYSTCEPGRQFQVRTATATSSRDDQQSK